MWAILGFRRVIELRNQWKIWPTLVDIVETSRFCNDLKYFCFSWEGFVYIIQCNNAIPEIRLRHLSIVAVDIFHFSFTKNHNTFAWLPSCHMCCSCHFIKQCVKISELSYKIIKCPPSWNLWNLILVHCYVLRKLPLCYSYLFSCKIFSSFEMGGARTGFLYCGVLEIL